MPPQSTHPRSTLNKRKLQPSLNLPLDTIISDEVIDAVLKIRTKYSAVPIHYQSTYRKNYLKIALQFFERSTERRREHEGEN
jgi:hypothetical protein